MKFKRVSALLLAAAMVTSMVACGNKDNGGTNDTKANDGSKAADASSESGDGERGTLIDGKRVDLKRLNHPKVKVPLKQKY